MKIMAKPIIVAYEASDQKLLAAAATAQSSSNAAAASQESSLSGGAIAGVAIGSAAGGIILATVLTFLCLRFCLGYRREHDNNGPGRAKRKSGRGGPSYEIEGAGKHEVDSSQSWSPPQHQGSQRSVGHGTYDSSTTARTASDHASELPTLGSPIAGRVELASGEKAG